MLSICLSFYNNSFFVRNNPRFLSLAPGSSMFHFTSSIHRFQRINVKKMPECVHLPPNVGRDVHILQNSASRLEFLWTFQLEETFPSARADASALTLLLAVSLPGGRRSRLCLMSEMSEEAAGDHNRTRQGDARPRPGS